ncbi:MAG: hypothetical protein AABY22_01185, partial [Nanoarchaeota archaeon]
MEKKIKFSLKDKRHLETVFQLIVLIVSIFAISYLIHKSDSKIAVEYNTYSAKEVLSRILLGLNLIPSASAQASN